MAPQVKPKPVAPVTKKYDDDDPMKNKFKRVMDWGTPRIVTKNRTINMDAK